jgi:hypothetical protein
MVSQGVLDAGCAAVRTSVWCRDEHLTAVTADERRRGHGTGAAPRTAALPPAGVPGRAVGGRGVSGRRGPPMP